MRLVSQFPEWDGFLNLLDDGVDCRFCGTRLSPKMVEMYEHDGGIMTPLEPTKQWVYVTCKNPRCAYQWSWVKILRIGKARPEALEDMGN